MVVFNKPTVVYRLTVVLTIYNSTDLMSKEPADTVTINTRKIGHCTKCTMYMYVLYMDLYIKRLSYFGVNPDIKNTSYCREPCRDERLIPD